MVLTFESVEEIVKNDHSNIADEHFFSCGTVITILKKVILCVDEILKYDHSNEQYFPVVLLIMLHKVDLTFESVKEILKHDHSNESY